MRNLLLVVLILFFLLLALAFTREVPLGGLHDAVPPPLRPGVAPVSFERLSAFTYGAAVPRESKGHIPESVRSLDGKRVRLLGHLVATEQDSSGKISGFALSHTSPECCFGRMPRINEWVLVAVGAEIDMPAADRQQKVWVTGRLRVGEVERDGVVVALYRMQAEVVE